MKELRIVTSYPAPSEMSAYEPFVKKGDKHGVAYGFHVIPKPSSRDLEKLKKKYQTCVSKGEDCGYFESTHKISTVIFSLSADCLTEASRPRYFETFIKFCATLGIDVFGVLGEENPVCLKLDNIKSLQEVQNIEPGGFMGVNPDYRVAKNRVALFSQILTSIQANENSVAFVTDREEGQNLQPFRCQVGFGSLVQPTAGAQMYVQNSDCSALSLLLFGRDITSMRKQSGY